MHDNNDKQAVAIIGSGNIGTDLMIKVMRNMQSIWKWARWSASIRRRTVSRARERLGVPTTAEGIEGLVALPNVRRHPHRIRCDLGRRASPACVPCCAEHGIRVIDLTPAAIGPYVVPVVNLFAHLDAPNVNMVTCGGQATIPIVAAVSRVAKVHYAEIVASIAADRRAPARARTSTSSPRPPRRRSKPSAARRAARRSSCSIRPSRR